MTRVFKSAIDVQQGIKVGGSTSSGYVLTSDGSGNGTWQVASGGGITLVKLASDATGVVGTAYANAASGLDVAVTSGVPLNFVYNIHWVPNLATTGGRFSINGPTITRLSYMVRWNTTATVITTSPLGTSYDQAFTVGTASDLTNNIAIVEGMLVPSANGTLALRSSAEVISPGSVTVKAGSSVTYW